MAPKYKYEIEDKVWIIPLEEIGIIIDITGNKYEVHLQRFVQYYDQNGDLSLTMVEDGYITCMAHELLPYTEGMELLYDI
jgi:hypothetical protein